MLQAASPFHVAGVLTSFADMVARSRAPNGDWQGDGWGVGWLDASREWRVRKSVNPIWEDAPVFSEIPATTALVTHARSASFPEQKNILAYNQPFAAGPYAFVFNGFLQGVSLPFPVEGKIGSQKIWSLLADLLKVNSPEESLRELVRLLESHSRRVLALNIGLFVASRLFALCSHDGADDYYRLRVHRSATLTMVSSEEFGDFAFDPAPMNAVLAF